MKKTCHYLNDLNDYDSIYANWVNRTRKMLDEYLITKNVKLARLVKKMHNRIWHLVNRYNVLTAPGSMGEYPKGGIEIDYMYANEAEFVYPPDSVQISRNKDTGNIVLSNLGKAMQQYLSDKES